MLTHLLNVCLEVVKRVMDLNGKIGFGHALLTEGSVHNVSELQWQAVLGSGYLVLTVLFVVLWLLRTLHMTRKIIKYDKLLDHNFTADPNNWVLISPCLSNMFNKFLRCIGFTEVKDCTCGSIMGVYFRRICAGYGSDVTAEDAILEDESTLRGFWLWCALFFCVMFNVPTELRDMITRLHPQKSEAVVYACYDEDPSNESKKHRVHQYLFIGSPEEYAFQNHAVSTPLMWVNLLCIVVNIILLWIPQQQSMCLGPQQQSEDMNTDGSSFWAKMSLLSSLKSVWDDWKLRSAFQEDEKKIKKEHEDVLDNAESKPEDVGKSLRMLDMFFGSCEKTRKRYEQKLHNSDEATKHKANIILRQLTKFGIGSAPAPKPQAGTLPAATPEAPATRKSCLWLPCKTALAKPSRTATSAQADSTAAAPTVATRRPCLWFPCLHAFARPPHTATATQAGPAADHGPPDLEGPAGQNLSAQPAAAPAPAQLGATSSIPLLA